MNADDEYFLPLTGSPKPVHLFSHPNNDQGDFLADIQICNQFGLSITSRGTVYIHRVPDFECVSTHTIRNFSTCQIQDDDHIIVLHTTRPLIYNTEFAVTTDYLRRPTFQNTPLNARSDIPTYLCSSYDKNLFVGVTSTSAICLWDVRTDEAPRVLTISKHFNIQTVSIKNDTIVIGHETGRISVLDSRNMIKRINQIDFSSQIQHQKTAFLKNVNEQNNPFNLIPTTYHRTQNQEFRITQSENEPWIVGFQYTNGPAGIIDLMSKKVTHQINPPPYEANQENRFSKPKPLFYKNTFCVAYRWSPLIQVIDYTALNYGYDYYNDEEPPKLMVKKKKEESIFSSSDDDDKEPESSDFPFDDEKLRSIPRRERPIIDLNQYRINIPMEICPTYLCGCNGIDGIYAASSLGDIYQVF